MKDLFNYLMSKPVDISPRAKYANVQQEQPNQEAVAASDPRGNMPDPSMMAQMQPQTPVIEDLLNALSSIVDELNNNAYKIADLLEPLTQITNNLQQWYAMNQANQEEEQGALKLQQLVNKQQQMAQIRAMQQAQAQQVMPPQQAADQQAMEQQAMEQQAQGAPVAPPTQKKSSLNRTTSIRNIHDLLRNRVR
jgi:hypothetical protein